MKALRVLVVEDDALIGMLLAEMLTAMGHEVCAVEATESDAVAAAARHGPDLMLVDVNLGAGSGIAAIDEILRRGPMPHVFMSGARLRAGRPGAVVLQKPFLEFDLVRAIERALPFA